MDPRLLHYYNRELQHVREIGAEFAAEYPKIAARLGLENFECSDPYVERLFEGFAFMAARVQLKVDAEFPNFTQSLLEIIYPHYLAATPSMTVVEFKPELNEQSLAEGFLIPKGCSLRSQIAKGEQTACEYQTAYSLQLWPLEISQIEYLPTLAAVSSHGLADSKRLNGVKAAIRIGLKCRAGVRFNQLNLQTLPLFLRGTGAIPYRMYEQYFAFPERYLFTELSDLSQVISACDSDELELFVLLDRSDAQLINALDKSNLALFCVPAINLFAKRTDRLHVDKLQSEYHVVVDRTRPMDFEIFSIDQVSGFGNELQTEQVFLPLYGSKSVYQNQSETAFYTLS